MWLYVSNSIVTIYSTKNTKCLYVFYYDTKSCNNAYI